MRPDGGESGSRVRPACRRHVATAAGHEAGSARHRCGLGVPVQVRLPGWTLRRPCCSPPPGQLLRIRKPADTVAVVADDLARPVDFALPLSIEEASVLLRALDGYVASWHEHYLDDGGATHPPAEWEEVRVSTGQLIWRIEEAARLPGQAVAHSAYAVKPPPDEEGGAGVREPRRPRPSAPSTHGHYGG